MTIYLLFVQTEQFCASSSHAIQYRFCYVVAQGYSLFYVYHFTPSHEKIIRFSPAIT